ncbi:60S ribosomal protein L11-1 [Tanacetum coccineum]|uniref:60S ribosomal protein L11-1 n=1 Tax=Tanacetum coccineum TaxID=301880 RepID=A0ABQ5GRB7_9ASTR
MNFSDTGCFGFSIQEHIDLGIKTKRLKQIYGSCRSLEVKGVSGTMNVLHVMQVTKKVTEIDRLMPFNDSVYYDVLGTHVSSTVYQPF